VCRFPLFNNTIKKLSENVDEIYLRFDDINGDKSIIDNIDEVSKSKIKGILYSKTRWDTFTWREEMLRMLDDVKPDLVLSVDQDEIFEDTIKTEMMDFYKSDKLGMMFNYVSPMPTDDGSIILGGKPYPLHPHMKAYKWKPDLTYLPYCGNAKIRKYSGSRDWYMAKTKILHYSMYRKEWQVQKESFIKKFWGTSYFRTWYKQNGV
jgi:hypothetical protein